MSQNYRKIIGEIFNTHPRQQKALIDDLENALSQVASETREATIRECLAQTDGFPIFSDREHELYKMIRKNILSLLKNPEEKK